MSFPSPTAQPLVGHLGRWGRDPITLLAEGAALGPAFSLRLWRNAVVGYTPGWNRLVLGDLETFRSRGSLSGLSPYLAGGLVRNDAPFHRPRRRVLNPPFRRTALAELEPRIAAVAGNRLPDGDFDAGEWSSDTIRAVLSEVFFGGALPTQLLDKFLAPLDRRLPSPFLPRPRLFRRMNRALGDALSNARPGTLGAAFSGLDDGIEEARVALAAAYDTTAHTLAWLLWHLAGDPSGLDHDQLPRVLEETLRCYPAGWVGTRIAAAPVIFEGVLVPAGTLVMYSPLLTHHDPAIWTDPCVFRPDRFLDPLPAWGFIPFAAGERSCLGAHLARLVLLTVARQFSSGSLTRTGPNPGVRAAITLAARGPLRLSRTSAVNSRSARPTDRRFEHPAQRVRS